MTSEISFAGIVLGVPTPEIEDYIESTFSLADIVQFTKSSTNVDTQQWNRSGHDLDERVIINRLTWPTGADRWAMFHGIILEKDIAKLRTKHGPQKFRFHDLVCEGMYALTPIPLQQTGEGAYLITVVDDRFWWWQRTGVIASQSTWANLYSTIGSSLGVTITHPTVTTDFLSPPADFFSHYHYLPLLLEAVTQSVGHRLVRHYDGTIEAMSATQSLGLALANREYGLRGGGKLKPFDFALGLPSTFRMVFPRSDAGVISLSSHYASTYTPDTQLQRKLGTLRGTDSQTVNSTAIAYYSSGGSIQNAAELDALADALGEAWYRWRLAPFEMTIGGIFEWDQEGMHDLYFEVRDGHAHTSVRRAPVENLERVGHLGTYDDVSYAWDGDHVSRSVTNHGVFIAVPQNVSLTANTTALTLPDTETVYLSANGSHFIHGIANGIDGKRHRLWNSGANSWTLVNSSGSASAGNRVICSTGGNISLAANQSCEIDYQLNTGWRASIAVASNTTVNLTSPGAIQWAMLLDDEAVSTENLVQYYNATLVTLDQSSMWIDGGSVWLANAYTVTRPIMSIPYAVRSQDQTKNIGGSVRSLYSFTPATELVMGVCTAFDTSTGAISWDERVHDGGRTFSTGNLGTFGTTQKAYEPNNQTVAVGDIGFLWRGLQTLQPRAQVAITQAGNGTVPQIQSMIFTGQAGNSYTLAFEGATSGNSTLAYGAPSGNVVGGLQFALNELIGANLTTASGNGTTGSPYLITWGDNATHSLVQAGVYDNPGTSPLTLQWIWLPSYRTNYSGINLTLGNVTFNGTANGTISYAPNNTTLNITFQPNDFVGWAELTASNLSAAGWVYSGLLARPADVNAYYYPGRTFSMANDTIWERNNFQIPVGEHVRLYVGEQISGQVSVTETSTNLTWSVQVTGGGGTWKLGISNASVTATTGSIAFGASNTTVKNAIDALAFVSNNTVYGSGTQADPYLISMQSASPIDTIVGNASLLSTRQSYVCEYESYGPGTPNLSLQIANGTGPNGTFQGLANTTGNLTYGVPAYSNFGPLRIIGTDSSNVSMAISLGSNLYLSGSNRSYTINSNVSTGNGTSAGGNGDIQFSDGVGGFLYEDGGPTYVLQYSKTAHQLRVYNLRVDVANVGPKSVAVFDNSPNMTVDSTAGLLGYSVGAGADWAADPDNVKSALDRLAAAVAGLLGGAIP